MIRRGQIWWVEFGEPKGSKPGYRHPALVLQRDEVNASRIKVPKRVTGLRRDSVANASQIATVNKDDFHALAGNLPPQLLNRVNEGIRWFMGRGESNPGKSVLRGRPVMKNRELRRFRVHVTSSWVSRDLARVPTKPLGPIARARPEPHRSVPPERLP